MGDLNLMLGQFNIRENIWSISARSVQWDSFQQLVNQRLSWITVLNIRIELS